VPATRVDHQAAKEGLGPRPRTLLGDSGNALRAERRTLYRSALAMAPTPSRPLRGAVLAVSLLVGTSGAAEPGPVSAGGADAAPCPLGVRSALSEVACEIARSLAPGGKGPIRVAASSVPGPVLRGAELADRLVKVVAGAIGADAHALVGALSAGEARSRAATGERVVHLAPVVAEGQLRITVDVYPGGALGFWDRVSGRAPGPIAHAFTSRRIDGEVSSFLPPVPLVAGRVDRAALPGYEPIAIGCGDADFDGALEIVLVGRQKINVGRLRSGRFVAFAEASWSKLGPVAPSPLRDPIGSVEFDGRRGLLVGSSDRAHGVLLSSNLEKVGDLVGAVPWPEVGCLVRRGIALLPSGPCAERDVPGVPAGEPTAVDAVAGGVAVDPSGHARTLAAARAPDGSVTWRDAEGHVVLVKSAGAALATGDVDRDGKPDLLASEDTLAPAHDALVVRSWEPSGAIRDRLRLPVPDGIRALALCPPDDEGLSAIVLATRRELWVIR